jgi:hypothetical protein
MTVALGIVIIASVYLKINWWNKMEDYPDDIPKLAPTEHNVVVANKIQNPNMY